jgi:hypothetical protein
LAAFRDRVPHGDHSMKSFRVYRDVVATLGTLVLGFTPRSASAQGCEPIRFVVPVNLGAEGEAYQPSREWRATIAYRRLLSNQWFIGTEQRDSLAPGGSSPIFEIHTAIVDLAYAFNDRVRARVSIPFSKGSLTRTWADGQEHTQDASGIGDISVQGETWLFAPRSHERGNIGFGLGIKAPTGSHTKASQFYSASGSQDYPADQTIQPGDGGWAILTQVQAFQQVGERASVYAFGSYMLSPRDSTGVKGPAPNSTTNWSVPDVYSVRVGAAFNLLPDQGLSVSLGARLDGIPVRDLIGGGDETTVKRASRIYFAEPGLSYTRDRDNFTLSVPWRVKVNRVKSLYEQETNGVNAGGFAKYLVFASYSRRL